MILPSTLRGGVEEYNLTAARGAIAQGWEVHAAFPDRPGTATLIQDFRDSGIAYHPLEIAENENQLPSVTRHIPRFFRTLGLLIRLKPDVAQVTLPAPDHCMGSILACGMLQVPTVVRFGLVLPLETEINPLRIWAYQWVRSRCQQWVNHFPEQSAVAGGDVSHPGAGDCLHLQRGKACLRSTIQGADARTTLRRQVRQELNLPESTRFAADGGTAECPEGASGFDPGDSCHPEGVSRDMLCLGRRWGFASGARNPAAGTSGPGSGLATGVSVGCAPAAAGGGSVCVPDSLRGGTVVCDRRSHDHRPAHRHLRRQRHPGSDSAPGPGPDFFPRAIRMAYGNPCAGHSSIPKPWSPLPKPPRNGLRISPKLPCCRTTAHSGDASASATRTRILPPTVALHPDQV